MIDKNSTIVTTREQVSTDLGGDVAILHLQSGIYYSLNEVGARVWELIQEPRRVDALLTALLEEYEVPPEECETHLLTLLGELQAENLIVVSNGANS